MTITGINVIYAIEFELEELANILEINTNTGFFTLFDKVANEIKSYNLGWYIDLFRMPCCFFGLKDNLSKVYLGTEIFELEIDNVNKYIQIFESMEQFADIYNIKSYDKNKIEFLKLRCINSIQQLFELNTINFKFYSMPNGCEICD